MSEPGYKLNMATRRLLRSRRLSLATDMRTAFDEAIRRHVSELLTFTGARSVASYWAFDGEPDMTPLCRQLMSSGFRFALPVISSTKRRNMNFHSWTPDSMLTKNSYGIPEPQDTIQVPLPTVDILLMPLVAYDKSGNRIGMGAGYYDRCLESLRASAKPLRIGIAYSLQEIDSIDKNTWDIPLHGIVNEHGWFTFTDQ